MLRVGQRSGWAGTRLLLALLGAVLALGLAGAPGAGAAQPVPVEVGKVRLAAPGGGQAALLVPVRYPIQIAGQRVELRVSLRLPGRRAPRSWVLRGHASAGTQRAPERRRRFIFTHRVGLGPKLARQLRRRAVGGRARVGVYAGAVLDLNRDGEPEVESTDRERQLLAGARAGRRQCADLAQLRLRPGRRATVRLPLCGAPTRWWIAERPGDGVARIRQGKLIYRPAQNFRGTDSVLLRGRVRGGGRVADAPVSLKVTPGGISVRAIGDSVTAGFGYYDDGKPMPFTSLLSCKPAEDFYDDACSSNSALRDNDEKKIVYAPDYGLSNNVSWAAQWANEHGIVNYANYAVTGSEPKNWLPGGQLYDTTKQVIAEDPDYIVMTMGANPLLSEMLFGIDNMGCAIWADVTGKYRECIEEAFEGVQLSARLEDLYRRLVEGTSSRILLMQYHLSVPSVALAYSATQIAMMGALLNERIAAAAAAVSPERLRVVAPPHFDVGIDISPVYPSDYSCSRLGYEVDGQSVQSSPTQTELAVLHPLSFCSGPAEGPPWVISGDTGIHPSAAGYAQMAARLPAPVPRG